MFRKIVFPLAVAVSLLLGACTSTAVAPTKAPVATSVPPTAASTPTMAPTFVPPTVAPLPTVAPTVVPAFPMTITDGAKRKVTLDSVPARIISLTPSNTEILFAVGAGDLVVGVTQYCDFPAKAKELTKIGGFSAKSISIETIVSLKPDLVLANASGQESVIVALEQANIKVIAVNATSFDDVYANLGMTGKITGHAAEAAKVVDAMKARVATVLKKIENVAQKDRPTVFWEVWDEPLMTAGPGTFIGQMIGTAGGVNVFADLKEDYPTVSAEEIVKRNPAFILGPDSHGDKLVAEQLAARPGWKQIDAVKNNKVFLVDGNSSSRPGPRLVDALEAIAKALYPDLFK